jgi:hypothetical protein
MTDAVISPRTKDAPIRSNYPVCDPNAFPRYVVSFYGGGNMVVSKAEYDAWEGVESTHRYIQHIAFPGCNVRLQYEGKFLPEYEKLTSPSESRETLQSSERTAESYSMNPA